jgi:tetratricopeptide (TPR) repeat protein
LNQLGLLLRLYFNPVQTFCRILDEGRLIFAAAAAIAVLLAIQLPRLAEYEMDETKAMMRAINARVEKAVAAAQEKGQKVDVAELREQMADEYPDIRDGSRATPGIPSVVSRFTALDPTVTFSPLIAIAICFVPIGIVALTRFEALGSFSMILQRDYSTLLVCALLSWTASHGLLLLVNRGLWALHNPAYKHPGLWWAAHAYFLLLTAIAIRTIFNVRFTSALGAIAGGWAGAIGGLGLYQVVGNPLMYVASPCLLYYLYGRMAPGLSSLGGGLGARQRLKQGLENATVNPHDADAHYQLGLIYAQRRQFDSAIASFRRAVEIAPNEPEAHYQLGRIARQQGRYSESLEHCRTAAGIDDKHSSSEVWREIGIAGFLDGDAEAARQTLEKYLDRRPYDPEALCWYGRVMASLNRPDAARSAFEQTIESVRTMPPGRQRQLRSWESDAAKELKKLPAAAGVAAVS